MSKVKEMAAEFREMSTIDLISIIGEVVVVLGVRELMCRDSKVDNEASGDERDD